MCIKKYKFQAPKFALQVGIYNISGLSKFDNIFKVYVYCYKFLKVYFYCGFFKVMLSISICYLFKNMKFIYSEKHVRFLIVI